MNNQEIIIIAAISENLGLGKGGKLLFPIKEDMRRFKTLTTGNIVIMGRKTFDSIGKPLPNRMNIVITRNPDFKPDGCVVVHSLSEALAYAKSQTGTIYIIGGGELYREALPIADKLYLTLIHQQAEADTFFPNYSEFKNSLLKEDHQTDEGLQYTFLELSR